jgi:hypothetical protein
LPEHAAPDLQATKSRVIFAENEDGTGSGRRFNATELPGFSAVIVALPVLKRARRLTSSNL